MNHVLVHNEEWLIVSYWLGQNLMAHNTATNLSDAAVENSRELLARWKRAKLAVLPDEWPHLHTTCCLHCAFVEGTTECAAGCTWKQNNSIHAELPGCSSDKPLKTHNQGVFSQPRTTLYNDSFCFPWLFPFVIGWDETVPLLRLWSAAQCNEWN